MPQTLLLRTDFVMRGGGSDGGSEASGGRGDPHVRCTHGGGSTFCSVGSNNYTNRQLPDHHKPSIGYAYLTWSELYCSIWTSLLAT